MTSPVLRWLSISIACGLACVVWSSLGGCGESPAPSTRELPDSAPPTALANGRTAVADVNGVPIYADCVTRQARHGGLSARAALDQCIDFELLAQAAHARGLSRHPEVLQASRRELVRTLLDQQIHDPMPSVAETDRSILEAAYKRYRSKIYAPERRQVFHLFAPFPRHRELRGTDADKAARAFADELYAGLKDRRGFTVDELYRSAVAIAGQRPLGPTEKQPGEPEGQQTGAFKREIFKVYRNQPNLPHAFSHGAMDIPEPGMISSPVRSDYGWHLILYLDSEPAKFATVEDSADYLFQAVRSEAYWNFTGGLLKQADIAVAEPALQRLQDDQDALFASNQESGTL